MSNSLSVAAVTATIAELLRFALAEHNGGTVPGALVTHLPPGNPSLDGGAPTVNVYLLSAGVEPALRNHDLPARAPDRRRVSIPKLPLSLSYLVSFHGDESKLEPQRLMGAAAIALHAQPVLGRALIRHVVGGTPWLVGSDLSAAAEVISVLLAPFSDPDMIGRFWMNFAGVNHHLALLYTASVVSLDAAVPVVIAAPVEEIGLSLGPVRAENAPAPLSASFTSAAGRVTALIAPQPGAGARCTLCLNGKDPPNSLLHSIAAVAGEPGSGVAFDVSAVPPGDYIALVVAEGTWSGRSRNEARDLIGPIVTVGAPGP